MFSSFYFKNGFLRFQLEDINIPESNQFNERNFLISEDSYNFNQTKSLSKNLILNFLSYNNGFETINISDFQKIILELNNKKLEHPESYIEKIGSIFVDSEFEFDIWEICKKYNLNSEIISVGNTHFVDHDLSLCIFENKTNKSAKSSHIEEINFLQDSEYANLIEWVEKNELEIFLNLNALLQRVASKNKIE